jgi:hypothetical protein
MYKNFNFLPRCKALNQDDLAELYLNFNWKPSLAVTGADGMPAILKSGNVVRPSKTLRISVRLPPIKVSAGAGALADAEETLLKDVPHGAKVELLNKMGGDGWCIKNLSEKTAKVLNDASSHFFDKECGEYGIGESILLLKVLGDKYPEAKILAPGVLEPDANAHVPNEILDLTFSEKFIMTLSHFLAGLA